MSEIETIADKVDQAVIKSRLNSLAVMMMTDRAERLKWIMTVLSKLKPGAYLVGTGPSTVGIISLTVEEVVLGRWATPVETPSDTVVDHQVGDTMYLGPYEVSRVHAKVIRERRSEGYEFRIGDLGSRSGTFVNGEAIGGDGDERMLHHTDAISLGASGTSTYLFIVIDR